MTQHYQKPPPAPIGMTLDNALKALLALLIGLLGYMGREQAARVERVEQQLGQIKIDVQEIRTHLKYITGLKTGDNGTGPTLQPGVSHFARPDRSAAVAARGEDS